MLTKMITRGDYSGSLIWEHNLSNLKTNSSSTVSFKMMSQCHSWSSLCRTTLRFGVEFDYSFKSIYYYDEMGAGGLQAEEGWCGINGCRLQD